MTNKEAISNLNHIYGMVAPDIQRSLDLAIYALEQIAPVMKGGEERPQGKWIFDTQNIALGTFGVRNNICSECRHTTKYKYPFCPWCGAEMERQFYE